MENISEPTPIADRSELSSSGLGKGLQCPLTFGLVSCSAVGALLCWLLQISVPKIGSDSMRG